MSNLKLVMEQDLFVSEERSTMVKSEKSPASSISINSSYPKTLTMFRVTQEIDFCYGHRLLNYSGKCKHLHGHNGRAIIVLEGETLDDRGMVVDFSDIKAELRTWIDETLDHRMILCENDPALPAFKQLGEPLYIISTNPTAENIAKLIFDRAQECNFPVVEVSLWETARSCATYRG